MGSKGKRCPDKNCRQYLFAWSDETFCHDCGATLVSRDKDLCPKCGEDRLVSYKFCPKCGHSFINGNTTISDPSSWNWLGIASFLTRREKT